MTYFTDHAQKCNHDEIGYRIDNAQKKCIMSLCQIG